MRLDTAPRLVVDDDFRLTSSAPLRQVIGTKCDFEDSLYSTDRNFVEKFVQNLILSDFLRRKERKQGHGYPIRCPNFPALFF